MAPTHELIIRYQPAADVPSEYLVTTYKSRLAVVRAYYRAVRTCALDWLEIEWRAIGSI